MLAITWVGFMLKWVGSGWVDENGPTSNSDVTRSTLVAVYSNS